MAHEFSYTFADGQVILEPRPELSDEINQVARGLLSAVIVRDGVCYTTSIDGGGIVKIVLRNT